MLAELKKLNFIPAAGLESSTRPVHVVPEMSIELENNLLTVNSSSNTLPRLGIVQQYLKLLEDPQTPEETRQYLREKLSNAENLLKSLELRQDTLTRITNVIAEKQADFFRYGIAHLQPMTMAEVAQTLDLHETTVSRAVARLNLLCELCLPYVKKGGAFIAMKGQEMDVEIKEAYTAIKTMGAVVEKKIDYPIPGTDIVHKAVVLRKVADTPKKYPRRWAQIKKSPL